MLAKDLKRFIQRELHIISNKTEHISHDPHHYIFLESVNFISNLKKILAKLNDEDQLADSDYSPIIDLIRKHSARTQNNAFYSGNPSTHANQICIRLAEFLAPYVHIHKNKILLPLLIMRDEYNYDVDIRKVVMSDDQKTFIDVAECLKNAERNHEKLMHTHPIDDDHIYLSENESKRVIHFSRRSERYFKDIENNASQASLNKAHQRLKNVIGYAYALNSNSNTAALLHQELYPDLKKCTYQDLANYMLEYPLKAWPYYLSNISLTQLENIMHRNRDISDAITDKSFYKQNNEDYNRAVFVLFTHLYYLKRESQDKYTGLWGRITRYADDKDVKLKHAQSLYQNLLSGKHFNEFPPATGASSQGILGLINKQITKVADQNYFLSETHWLPTWRWK